MELVLYVAFTMQKVLLGFVSISQGFLWSFNIDQPNFCSDHCGNVSLPLILLDHVLSGLIRYYIAGSKPHSEKHQFYFTMVFLIFKPSYMQWAPWKAIIKSVYVLRTSELSLPWNTVSHSSTFQCTTENCGKMAMK